MTVRVVRELIVEVMVDPERMEGEVEDIQRHDHDPDMVAPDIMTAAEIRHVLQQVEQHTEEQRQ